MTTSPAAAGPLGDLVIQIEGGAGIVRLNRPKALNALTLDMVRGISGALDDFERDPGVATVIVEGAGDRGFCAGSDIRGLYESIRASGDLGRVFWRNQYRQIARIASFPKPYVALMDGIVMGGGVGLTTHGRHRVVTETTRLAMPEAGIGFFPDVGGTWFLSRGPGETGTYFALTGLPMNGVDAIRAGLADVLVPANRLPALREALLRVGPSSPSRAVGETLALFATPSGAGPSEQQRALIDSTFGYDTVEEIFVALERDGSDFARQTLQILLEKSPTSLKLTLRLLRLSRSSPSLEACLIREYGAALKIFANRDFPEGIRAAVIDKDKTPRWSPARIEDVGAEAIAEYLIPPPPGHGLFAEA